MEITDVRAVPLSAPVPEEHQHRTDLGTKVKVDAVLVFVEIDSGETGIGPALPVPTSSATGVCDVVENDLRPLLVGEDPTFIRRLWEKCYSGTRWPSALERGHPQPRPDRRGITIEALSGVDVALWDLRGKVLEEPVYTLLGAVRSSIPGYASGWVPGDETGTAKHFGVAFDAVKVRLVGEEDFSLANAKERVATARERLGEKATIMVDAHASLETGTARRLANRIEPYDIAWFEEPVSPDDIAGMAAVRRSTDIPIAAGEWAFTRFDVRDLIAAEAVDVVQPDVARAGGLTECLRIASLASAHGIRTTPHGWGDGVTYAASIHLAMATPNCRRLEVSQGHLPLTADLFEEPFDVRDGRVYAPDRPGLGFTLRDDAEEIFPYEPGPEYVY